MPTLTEINKPQFKYCQKYKVHCPCPKCENICKLYPVVTCNNCTGPYHREKTKGTIQEQYLDDEDCINCLAMTVSFMAIVSSNYQLKKWKKDAKLN